MLPMELQCVPKYAGWKLRDLWLCTTNSDFTDNDAWKLRAEAYIIYHKTSNSQYGFASDVALVMYGRNILIIYVGPTVDQPAL